MKMNKIQHTFREKSISSLYHSPLRTPNRSCHFPEYGMLSSMKSAQPFGGTLTIILLACFIVGSVCPCEGWISNLALYIFNPLAYLLFDVL